MTWLNCLLLTDFLLTTFTAFSKLTFGRLFCCLFFAFIDFFSDTKCVHVRQEKAGNVKKFHIWIAWSLWCGTITIHLHEDEGIKVCKNSTLILSLKIKQTRKGRLQFSFEIFIFIPYVLRSSFRYLKILGMLTVYCTMYSTLYSTVYIVQCTVYCTVYIVQCTVPTTLSRRTNCSFLVQSTINS